MSAKFLFGSVLSTVYYINSRKERKKTHIGAFLGRRLRSAKNIHCAKQEVLAQYEARM